MTEIVLVGRNPGGVWRSEDEVPVAAVSYWEVEWSPRGAGRALVCWPGGADVLVITRDDDLARWLWSDFTRWFPEFEPACDAAPTLIEAEPRAALDPQHGLTVETDLPAGRLRVRLGRPGEPRVVDVPDFGLGGVSHRLRNVLWRCDEVALELPGSLGTLPPFSSTFGYLALAEVWERRAAD